MTPKEIREFDRRLDLERLARSRTLRKDHFRANMTPWINAAIAIGLLLLTMHMTYVENFGQ
jgi:hypothetical protein